MTTKEKYDLCKGLLDTMFLNPKYYLIVAGIGLIIWGYVKFMMFICTLNLYPAIQIILTIGTPYVLLIAGLELYTKILEKMYPNLKENKK